MKTRAARPRLWELLLLIAGLGVVAQASISSSLQNASTAPPASQTTKSVAERLGYAPNARLLMIHADDVGMMHSVDRASFEALEKGWITSASIMVPCPWFPEVAHFAQAHPDVDMGIHLVLNSEWTSYRWGPVSRGTLVPTLLDADGYLPLLEEAVMRQASAGDVEHELRAQIEKAHGAGIRITHLDSHMETLLRTRDLLEVYARVARSYQVPALYSREDFGKTTNSPFAEGGVLIDRVLEMQPGVTIEKWTDAYEQMLRPLPPGVYQLRVHLAYDDEEMRAATADHPDWGAAWRQADFDMVRSPEFQRFLRDQGFQLVRWKDLARALPQEKTAP
jgi:predicted glycoside hydrolase/deacetylase ChbG (UPF0249 family)